jgi:hypothetical protein
VREEVLYELLIRSDPATPGCNFHDVSVVTLDDGTEVTVDWTARQFDPNLPFPLISIKEP